jgi:hypothetical protein
MDMLIAGIAFVLFAVLSVLVIFCRNGKSATMLTTLVMMTIWCIIGGVYCFGAFGLGYSVSTLVLVLIALNIVCNGIILKTQIFVKLWKRV